MRILSRPQPKKSSWVLPVSGFTVGALMTYLFDPDKGKGRRKKAVDMMGGRARRAKRRMERAARFAQAEAHGMKQKVLHLKEESKTYDDATLKAKVETHLFGDRSVPKGSISINVEDCCVVLRGEVGSPSDIRRIEKAVRKIPGVEGVNNMLRLKGEASATLDLTDKEHSRT